MSESFSLRLLFFFDLTFLTSAEVSISQSMAALPSAFVPDVFSVSIIKLARTLKLGKIKLLLLITFQTHVVRFSPC
uniref:Secreted protein n=1 Tax=Anguilla anguilla TaxID=7936 RepID=A0A0E9RRS1_ANGAN